MQDLLVKSTTISSRYQTVVPVLARKALGLKKGDKIIWNIDLSLERPEVKIRPKLKDWGNYLSGLGKHLWQGVDSDRYLRTLRKEWER